MIFGLVWRTVGQVCRRWWWRHQRIPCHTCQTLTDAGTLTHTFQCQGGRENYKAQAATDHLRLLWSCSICDAGNRDRLEMGKDRRFLLKQKNEKRGKIFRLIKQKIVQFSSKQLYSISVSISVRNI